MPARLPTRGAGVRRSSTLFKRLGPFHRALRAAQARAFLQDSTDQGSATLHPRDTNIRDGSFVAAWLREKPPMAPPGAGAELGRTAGSITTPRLAGRGGQELGEAQQHPEREPGVAADPLEEGPALDHLAQHGGAG